jgi:hypothetical protein
VIGDRYAEAEMLSRVGDTHRADGGSAVARAVWLEALSVLDKLGHADTAGVRAKLAAL